MAKTEGGDLVKTSSILDNTNESDGPHVDGPQDESTKEPLLKISKEQRMLLEFNKVIRLALYNGEFGPTDLHIRSFHQSYKEFLR